MSDICRNNMCVLCTLAMYSNLVMTDVSLQVGVCVRQGSEQITGFWSRVEVCANYNCLCFNWYQPYAAAKC